MSTTVSINTPERPGLITRVPVAAATRLFAGNLGARDASGNALPASNTAGLQVLGVVVEDADNSAGIAAALGVDLREGTFRFKNSGTNALSKAHVGQTCYVENEETVASTASNKIEAGVVAEVESSGVWVRVRRQPAAAAAPPAIRAGSVTGTFAGGISTVTVTFSSPMPNSSFAVVCTWAAGGPQPSNYRVSSQSASGFVVSTNGVSDGFLIGLNYVAIANT